MNTKTINTDKAKQLIKENKYKFFTAHFIKRSNNKQRIFNFLIDDLIKLKKDIKENNNEEIEIFFNYWNQHINLLNELGLKTNLLTNKNK